MRSSASWWARKVRQFRTYLRARVDPQERAALAGWLTDPQLALFDSMHVADRRHGLDVVAALRAGGPADGDLLLAGLLHDSGKGETAVGPRVVYSLGQMYGPWVWRLGARLPGFEPALDRLRGHAEASARLAEAAACPPRTVDLIRHQDAPMDLDAGRRLLLADEAN